ncbi:hypothetical protein TNCV_4011071 [Trichonephila clavipes]|nr:hypothetical protein TNCV_4011071 [Trichonephila clavipes]
MNNFVVLITVLYDLIWFTDVNEQNIKKNVHLRFLLKEVETDQTVEEPAERMQINEDSETRCKKPDTIAEELILPAATDIVETMFGDNFAKEMQSIPLSNDTVPRRIDDIAEDVEQ